MTLEFKPPAEKKIKLPRYASYSQGVMKVHGRICDAKNSLNNRMWRYENRVRVASESFLLEMVEGKYYVLYHIPEGATKDNLPWVKEFVSTRWSGRILFDSVKDNKFYLDKIADGSYRLVKESTTMSTDEYVAWRIAVEHERLGIKKESA